MAVLEAGNEMDDAGAVEGAGVVGAVDAGAVAAAVGVDAGVAVDDGEGAEEEEEEEEKGLEVGLEVVVEVDVVDVAEDAYEDAERGAVVGDDSINVENIADAEGVAVVGDEGEGDVERQPAPRVLEVVVQEADQEMDKDCQKRTGEVADGADTFEEPCIVVGMHHKSGG